MAKSDSGKLYQKRYCRSAQLARADHDLLKRLSRKAGMPLKAIVGEAVREWAESRAFIPRSDK